MNKSTIISSSIAILTILFLLITAEKTSTIHIIVSVVSILSLIGVNFIPQESQNKIETIVKNEPISQNYDDEILNDLIDVTRQSSNGEYDVRVSRNSQNQKLQEISSNINTTLEQFRKTINSVVSFMDKYNKNDFTIQIENNYNNDLKDMIEQINHVNIKISKMLLSSLKNNIKLSANSDLLKANMDSLGRSVIEQSATLEQTAAAIEQITSTIVENNRNVQNMLTYSNNLGTSIEKGYSNAKDSATLMDEIDEKTKAIEEAIVVIDQIAFQTNILSLNAAVEAATAGEAGKGFAVVAAEVRSLASRAAEAAKEIKKLVGDATDVTKRGKVASNDMINEYTIINENIGKTRVIMNDVSNSLREQQRGIEQINNAVSQMDKITQENAQRAQHTLEVANVNDQMAKQMVVETNKTNFIGRDEFNKTQR